MKKILIIIAGILVSGCVHEVKMRAVVLDHVVTADRHGDRTYSTIIKRADGQIDEVTGLKYYVIPKGSEIITTVYQKNK